MFTQVMKQLTFTPAQSDTTPLASLEARLRNK